MNALILIAHCDSTFHFNFLYTYLRLKLYFIQYLTTATDLIRL